MQHDETTPKSNTSLKKYWPLLALILISALAASALAHTVRSDVGMKWMHFFMGFFLCQFAMFKLFNPSNFADGFQMYDLIGSRFRFYALVYPLIELALGLGYLSFIVPIAVYLVTILVLGVGAAGVIKALSRGLDVRCACMGTVLDVPLSTVTLVEDLGMVVMAIALLFL